MEIKFVTFIDRAHVEVIMVFPGRIIHKEFARSMTEFGYMPIAGGFVENGQCVGESESLRLKARPEDTKLLQEFNNKVEEVRPLGPPNTFSVGYKNLTRNQRKRANKKR